MRTLSASSGRLAVDKFEIAGLRALEMVCFDVFEGQSVTVLLRVI